MKKFILKLITSIVVFVGTLFACSFIMNRGNVNTTQDMERATLPVVYMDIAGESVNRLYGYKTEMDLGLLRENITPLDDKRGVTFRIDKCGQNISKITAKVRTVDGSRLIETDEITEYDEDDYSILASVNFKDLLQEYTEYSLQIYLTLSDKEEVFYHTRIIEASSYCTKEKLSFVRTFLDKELSVEENADLSTYMESNYLGDNTTLATVTIHSSLEQLAFGNLRCKRETEPNISIKEIATETGIFTADYLVTLSDGKDEGLYYVSEFYRIKYTSEVIYLLDYERNIKKLSLDNVGQVRTEDILLGVTSENVELVESDDGNIIAFGNAGTLYSYNVSEKKISRLFSFYDKSNFDERTYNPNYKVKALRADEAGNVWFSVSGYMNRGRYEGKTGIALYLFNGVTSEVEECFFIDSDKSSEIVNKDVEELCFLSKENIFYIMIDKTIYTVNTETKDTEILVSNLEENKYTISDNSTMMVWQTGDDVNASKKLMLMNLNTKQLTEISAGEDEYIKPLAFMDEDFIYGLAKKKDVVTDNTGRTTFPMYMIKIQSKFGEILKQYEEPDSFATQVEVKDNMITIERVKKVSEEPLSYAPVESETITDNQERSNLQNNVNTFVYGDYQTATRILLKKDVKGKVIEILPKEVIYEGTKELTIERVPSNKRNYYVYYKGALQKIYTNPANAVTQADKNYGNVLNDKGFYVWYRANRALRNQIMDLSPTEKKPEEERRELSYCLDKMLEYEGVVRNSQYLLNSGETVLSILKSGLEGKDVLDLTGCSLDSILYYVNRDIPVLALTHSEDTYLIIGFNQLAVVVYDPNEGWYKMGKNEAEELFKNNGNQFITYVTDES